MNPYPHAFGIDISDLSIKVIQLHNYSRIRRRPSFELADCRSAHLPAGLIVNGIIEQPEKVRTYISELLGGKKGIRKPIRSHWCVASIPEVQSFLKLITIPEVKEQILDEEIIDIAKKHIPFDEADSFIDWQMMPMASDVKEGHTSFLISASPQSVVRSYTYLLESLGLGIIALEAESLAIARSMITAEKNYGDEARAVIDIGATNTHVIVYDHTTVQFTTSIPYSGELVTTAISQRLRLSREDAETKKREVGLCYPSQDSVNQKVWQVTSELTTQLITEIEKAIRFYYSHFPHAHKVTQITLCGGASLLPGLDNMLSQQLHIDCKHGSPWKNIHGTATIPIDQSSSLSHATAIGLALRAAANPFFSSDMI